MTIYPVSMRDAARDVSITVKVVHVKRTRLRLWLFSLVLRLAVLVSPTAVTVESEA